MVEIELKKYNLLEKVSDWVELCVALNGEVTKSEVDHILQNNEYQSDNENYINSIWNELKVRNKRYQSINPMEIDTVSVTSNISWEKYPEYIMMLALSLEGNGWDTNKTAILFERICKEVLEEYIGGNAKVVGFPKKVNVRDICQEINEKFIYELPTRYKDRKLDVVGWKKIDDRSNKLIILMQCAAGNDWKGKTTELQVEVWSQYIKFGCKPTRAFGFTHCLDDNHFSDIGTEGGIIFDRIRLFKYLSTKKNISDNNLRVELKSWCDSWLEEKVA